MGYVSKSLDYMYNKLLNMIPNLNINFALASTLKIYNFKDTVSKLAGLLTIPTLQENNLRIEFLIHQAVIHSTGKRKPHLKQINSWLNEGVNETGIPYLEDPAENVFISNISSIEGNFRIFEGLWSSNNYSLQVLLDVLHENENCQEIKNLIKPSYALLKLSDQIAERINLFRWHFKDSLPYNQLKIVPNMGVKKRSNAITFSYKDLQTLGICRSDLDPFVFSPKFKEKLLNESLGNSSLERYPLIDSEGELVFSLPNSTGTAIKRFILSSIYKNGYLNQFNESLSKYQSKQIVNELNKHFQPEPDKFKKIQTINQPKLDSYLPPFYRFLYKFDIDKYLQVVLLHDILDMAKDYSLDRNIEYPEEVIENLNRHLWMLSKHLGTKLVHTLFIIGGIGRGILLNYGDHPNNWSISLLSLSEFLLVSSDSNSPLEKYLKCFEQKKWAENEGMQFININSDFHFYSYWRDKNYQLIPRNSSIIKGNINIHNYSGKRSIEILKRTDPHCLQTPEGKYIKINKYFKNSFFKSQKNLPIYYSIDRTFPGSAIKVKSLYWFILIPRFKNNFVKNSIHDLWADLLILIHKLLVEFETNYHPNINKIIGIRLNFEKVNFSGSFDKTSAKIKMIIPEIHFNPSDNNFEIIFPLNFLHHFTQPENNGENLVLSTITRGLLQVQNGEYYQEMETSISKIVDIVLFNHGLRILHIGSTTDSVKYLQSTLSRYTISEFTFEDFVFAKLKLAKACFPKNHSTQITKKLECKRFLNSFVDKILKQIKTQLHELDRTSVIYGLLNYHEYLLGYKEWWVQRSKALKNNFGTEEQIVKLAQKQELERTQAALSVRILLEIALCECPPESEKIISDWDMNELVAEGLLLLEVALDSDAIHKGIITSPIIDIHPNGEYTIDRESIDKIFEPFYTDVYNEIFEENVENYEHLYSGNKNKSLPETKNPIKFKSDFLNAFYSEFGLTFQNTFDCSSSLINLAFDQKSMIVVSTKEKLVSYLVKETNLGKNVCAKFLDSFCLVHRPNWEIPPPEYSDKDIFPWRYNRRLSITYKPILLFGNDENEKVIYGAGTLKQSFIHTLSYMEKGKFSDQIFKSNEMKSYVGSVRNELGHKFTHQVAKVLNLKEWTTRTEVQMRTLGASKKLGDLDVVAWNSLNQVLIIECKNLRFSRNIYEIAEICERFRGSAEDELDKHLERLHWLSNNLEKLHKIIGFIPDKNFIEGRLVTNIKVPIMYLETLPINTDHIITVDDLAINRT